MFKKLVAYLTLFSFFNNVCMEHAIANYTTHELVVEQTPRLQILLAKDEAGRLVIDPLHLSDTNLQEADFVFGEELVGSFKKDKGQLSLTGLGQHSFVVSDLPSIPCFKATLGGNLLIQKLLRHQTIIDLNVKGKTTFNNGFLLKGGKVVFEGGTVELHGTSVLGEIHLKNLTEFMVAKDALVSSIKFESVGLIKSFKILGELYAKYGGLTNIIESSVSGFLDLGQGALTADTIRNTGRLRAAHVIPKKRWINMQKANGDKAEVQILESLQANVDEFIDDGITEVYGLASVQAKKGRMTGLLKARNAMISFDTDLAVSASFEAFIQDFLHFHSKMNLNLQGNFYQKNFSWPTVGPKKALFDKLRELNKTAWVFSAGKDLTRGNRIKTDNKNLLYTAGGKYTGVPETLQRAGYFKQSIRIVADSARLADEMKATGDVYLDVKRKTELQGVRTIDGIFDIKTGELVQKSEDKNSLEYFAATFDIGNLDGHINFRRAFTLQIKDKLDAIGLKLIGDENASAVVTGKTSDVRLGGTLKNLTLHTDVKKLIFAEGYREEKLASSHVKAETVLHEDKSKRDVVGTNMQEATRGIIVDKGATVLAKNNIFRGGSFIFNAGNIESTNQYLGDTAFHLIMFGGRIRADHAVVMADAMNLNFSGLPRVFRMKLLRGFLDSHFPELVSLSCLQSDAKAGLLDHISGISARSTEINTTLNMNIGSVIRGTHSLRVNALLADINAGVYMSQNASINTIWKVSVKDLILSDPGGFFEKLSCDEGISVSSFASSGLMLGAKMLTGAPLFYIKGAQTLLSAALLWRSAKELWKLENQEDEASYWRLSRLAKRTGNWAPLVVQACQIGRETKEHIKSSVKILYPEEGDKQNQPTPPADQQMEKKQSEQKPRTWSQEMQESLKQLATFENIKSTAGSYVSGTLTVNAIWDIGDGFTMMPHINRNAVFLKDNSYNLAIDRTVKSLTGKDTSKTIAITNSVYSSGDFEYGATVVASQNSVHAAGDLILTKDMNSSAERNQFESDQKMTVEENTKTTGKTNTFMSADDMKFEGTSSADKIHIKSKNGRADVTKKAKLHISGDLEKTSDGKTNWPNLIVEDKTGGEFKAQVSGNPAVYKKSEGHSDFDPTMKGTSVYIDSKTNKIGGEGRIELSQNELAMIIKGKTEFHENTNITIGDKPIKLKEEDIDAAIQKAIEAEEISSQSSVNEEAKEISQSSVTEGDKADSQQPKNEDAKTTPSKPEPKYSIFIDGSALLNGNIALNHGIGIIDRDKEKNPTDEENDESKGIKLGSNLKLTGGGDLFADTDKKIIKEQGSEVSMANIYLRGDEGVVVDGKSLAQQNFVVQSKKDIIEAGTSRVKSGNAAVFYAEGRMVKEEGADAFAPEVIRHGEKGGECAGIVRGGQFAQFTIGEGKEKRLKIADGTVVDAPHQKVGSFAKTDEKKDECVKEAEDETKNIEESTNIYPKEDSVKQGSRSEKKSSSKSRVASRSKFQSDKREKKPKRDLQESREKKKEAPKPKSDLAPIHDAGEVDIGKDVQFKGKTLMLRGKGIGHINDLFTQTGYFEGVDITDYVYVHTDKDVTFDKSMTSASKGFELHTNEVNVMKNVNIDAPEVLRLHSTEKNLFLGSNSTLAAKVFLEVKSDKDIVGDFKKEIRYHKDGTQTVEYEGVTLIGGTGIKYTYIDPDTKVESERWLGISVDAFGKVYATGMKLLAPGDIHIHGFEGVVNKGASQAYVKSIKEKSNFWRKKTKAEYDTEFFMPAVVTNGKLVMRSENGGLKWHAGLFQAKEGADILLNGHAYLLPLMGMKGKRTERDTLIPFADRENRTFNGLAPSTVIVNQGDTKVRIWTSPDHDIVAPGLVYEGKIGTLDTRGRWGDFSRTILKNYSIHSGVDFSYDYSLGAHWKSLDSLKSAKHLIHNFNQRNWGGAFFDLVKPSISGGLNWSSTRSDWESLGAGSILTKDWVLGFRKGLITDNGYDVNVTGTMYTNGLPYWYQGGANLRYSSESNSVGLFSSMNSHGPSFGVRYGHSQTKGNKWHYGQIKIGTLVGDIGKIVQNGAHMDIGKLDGRIHDVVSYTKQDCSETSAYGLSIQCGIPFMPSGSAHGSYNSSLTTAQQSGITVEEVTQNGSIGTAYLEGSNIKGVKPEHEIKKSLPDDYNEGVSGGVGIGQSGFQNITAGYSKDGKQIQLSLNIANPNDKGKEEAEPWRQIGSISVNGISLPLVSDINPQFFHEFYSDLAQLKQSIIDSFHGSFVRNCLSPSCLPKKDVWTPLEDGERLEETQVVDLPYYEPPQPISQDEQETLSGEPLPVLDENSGLLPLVYTGSHRENQKDGDFIEGVEILLHSLNPGKKGLVHVPFLPTGNMVPASKGQEYPIVVRSPSNPTVAGNKVEELFEPFNLDGAEFKFRKGNVYLQSEELLEAYENARNRIFSSNSTYGPRALLDFEFQQTPLFLRNSYALLPYKEDLGIFSPWGDHKNKLIHGPNGTFRFGQTHIELAAFPEKLSLYETFAHEIEHNRLWNMNKGSSWLPGYVPGNPSLTEANRLRLLQAYAHEYIALNSNRHFNGLWSQESSIFSNALNYFDGELRKHIQLNDVQYGQLGKQFMQEAFSGRRLSNYSLLPPELRNPVLYAENMVMGEIPAHLAQIDVRNTKWLKSNSANTHEMLESFGNKFLSKPSSPKPIVFDPHLLPLNESFSLWSGVKKFGKYSLPLLDWGIHVGSEMYSGQDFSDSLIKGSAKTAIDVGVYGGFYEGVSFFMGGPAAWMIGGVMAADEILPSYSHEDIYDCFAGHNEFDFGYSSELAESMAVMNAIHGAAKWTGIRWIGQKLHSTSEYLYEKLDETFQSFIPATSALIHYQQLYDLNESAKYLESAGFVNDKLPVRNPGEIFEEAFTKYQKSRGKNNSDHSSGKGKENGE